MHAFWETILLPILCLLRPRTIVEIGVEAGRTSEHLLAYGKQARACVHGIDPAPLIDEPEWHARWGDIWTLHRNKSLSVLPTLPPFDVILIDGDHNWYTVTQELLLIEQHAQRHGTHPVIFVHDIDAPYGRRDRYDDPSGIPAHARHPWAPVSVHDLNPHANHALHEGGPRNGIRTALEDFLTTRTRHYAFVSVTGFFGLGILIPRLLLQQHAPLRHFLADLTPADRLHAHMQHLEHERLALLALRHKLECHMREHATLHLLHTQLRQDHAQLIANMDTMQRTHAACEQALATAHTTLAHLRQTRSWRWTAWLRSVSAGIACGMRLSHHLTTAITASVARRIPVPKTRSDHTDPAIHSVRD